MHSFIIPTIHQPPNTSSPPYIIPTIHHPHDTSSPPYITPTIHHPHQTSPPPYITATIHHPHHTLPPPYIILAIHHLHHTSSPPYIIFTIHHPHHTLSPPYITPTIHNVHHTSPPPYITPTIYSPCLVMHHLSPQCPRTFTWSMIWDITWTTHNEKVMCETCSATYYTRTGLCLHKMKICCWQTAINLSYICSEARTRVLYIILVRSGGKYVTN